MSDYVFKAASMRLHHVGGQMIGDAIEEMSFSIIAHAKSSASTVRSFTTCSRTLRDNAGDGLPARAGRRQHR